jgi:predicted RNase H-like nuclease (RuvC/YqgF family)
VKHILSEEMQPVDFYFTWDHRLQELEDNIQEMRHRLENGQDISMDELEKITDELRKASLGNEDWNAMRRQIYKLERDYYKSKCEDSCSL